MPTSPNAHPPRQCRPAAAAAWRLSASWQLHRLSPRPQSAPASSAPRASGFGSCPAHTGRRAPVWSAHGVSHALHGCASCTVLMSWAWLQALVQQSDSDPARGPGGAMRVAQVVVQGQLAVSWGEGGCPPGIRSWCTHHASDRWQSPHKEQYQNFHSRDGRQQHEADTASNALHQWSTPGLK